MATQISFYFHPYLGKIPIFWNHQLVLTTTRIRNQLDRQAPGGTVAYPHHGGGGADDDAGSGALMTTLVADWCPTVLNSSLKLNKVKISQSAKKKGLNFVETSVSSRTRLCMHVHINLSSYWRKRRMVPFFTHLDLLLLKIFPIPNSTAIP